MLLRTAAILLMIINLDSVVTVHAQNNDDPLPPFSRGWTDAETAHFRECVSHISDPNHENSMQLGSDRYACLIFQEQEHWMNSHPQAHGRKENIAKEHRCFDKHPLQIKGTPEEFHSSFDLCMCAAYGLPKPKP